MPPVRTSSGRASKACDGCRKGKTRCYPEASGVCLRCHTLGLVCSLTSSPLTVTVPSKGPVISANGVSHDCALVEDRLASLENVVLRLSEAVGFDSRSENDSSVSRSSTSVIAGPPAQQEPPILVIQNAVSELDRSQDANSAAETIVDKGLVTRAEAEQLLMLFCDHYRRWISLRDSDQRCSEPDFWSSPLLLCACCLVAIRHWSGQRARQTANLLFDEVKNLLNQQLLISPQPLEFFQAILVLSLWSTTVGQKPLSIDSWMITGFAIQHRLATDAFMDQSPPAVGRTDPSTSVGKLLLWSRLCLSHLHACISIRRRSWVSKSEIDQITTKLSTVELSNFESRMVAEINLYLTIHENALATVVPLVQAQAALQSWKQAWSHLLEQPRAQFLKMGFYFAQLLVFEQSLTRKSAAVRQSLVTEMTRICSTIMQLAMNTTDERTKYLTDHIYHVITYAAVTLCRLLCKYEMQLKRVQDLRELDDIISNTIEWLHSLGSSTHIGHMMSTVIGAVHRKLRPEAALFTSEVDHAEADLLIFPDLLGINMDPTSFDWDAMAPDWQSLTSEDTIRTPNVS